MAGNPWIPDRPHPKQQQFLLHSFTREVLYGGAARGGKTYASLMAAAQYVDVPGYAALLLRTNFPDLMQPGALIPVSKEWWTGRADWNAQGKRWTFPSGATVSFGYLDSDDAVFQYQGTSFQFVGFDELTQHTERRYRYLFSRLSRPESGPLAAVPLRMRATSNPGGRGHEWVKARFIDPRTRPPGTVFVPARVEDNPAVDVPAYVESLSYLDPITRAQLLAGDWDAVEGGRFRREWFPRYDRRQWPFVTVRGHRFDPATRQPFLVIDTAASEKTSADFTVVSSWCLSPAADLVLLDLARFRAEIPEVLDRIKAAVRKWKPAFVGIEEVGAHSGKAVGQLLRRATDPAMTVRSLNPGGADKLMRATAAITLAHDGRIWLPEDAELPGLADAVAELIRFTGRPEDCPNDDFLDCVAYASALLPQISTVTSAPMPKGVGGLPMPGGPVPGRPGVMPRRVGG